MNDNNLNNPYFGSIGTLVSLLTTQLSSIKYAGIVLEIDTSATNLSQVGPACNLIFAAILTTTNNTQLMKYN